MGPFRLLVAMVMLVGVAPAGAAPRAERAAAPPLEEISQNFELIGHTSLNDRGMNAAIAAHGDFVYVGSRTDSLPNHKTPGILVVDVANPAAPRIVHEIKQPDAGAIGETSRELRIWPQQELLVVLNFKCSEIIHACSPTASAPRFTFFDISGDNAAAPKLVATYSPTLTPHEFYLWVDPHRSDKRALLFWTAPTTSRTTASMVVTDISKARDGVFTEQRWPANFTASGEDRRLHSISVSNDGKRTYLAFLGSGFLVLDTSEVALGLPNAEISWITQPADRVKWGDPGTHTSVRLFDSDIGFTTDEVYGDALDPVTMQDHGCPWGWMRTIDLSDEAKPKVIGEYKVEENDPAFCTSPNSLGPAGTLSTSYASHNPTFTDRFAFVTWHSAGLEVVDFADPAAPVRAGKFKPSPVPVVQTEDPALSGGPDKVVMWSYPIIKDGLIYVLDLRNGLYILKYTGPGAEDIDSIGFLEGNSNLGDALRYESVPNPPVGSPNPLPIGNPVTSAPTMLRANVLRFDGLKGSDPVAPWLCLL
jgi:hypothetical protein